LEKIGREETMKRSAMGMIARAVLASCAAAAVAFPVLSQSGGGAGQWTAKAKLPMPSAEIGVAELGGKIYVLGGGIKGNNASPLNQEYDPATDQWSERAPLPKGVSHVGAASMNGKVYSIGGFLDVVHVGAQDVAFEYDPATDHWRALASLSSPRASVAAVAIGGKLHVIGGRGLDKVTVATHEVWDPATNIWSKAAPLPKARDHMGVAAIDGKIHVFGGRFADTIDNTALHDVYDPATDAWHSAAPMPTARSSGAYTVYRGLILFAGGECRRGGKPGEKATYDEVEAYDPKTDRWSVLAPLPEGRHAFGAATVGDAAYFIGGTTTCGGGYSDDVLAFTLP
jgi:N-acetylneuraminic acid mutarotase